MLGRRSSPRDPLHPKVLSMLWIRACKPLLFTKLRITVPAAPNNKTDVARRRSWTEAGFRAPSVSAHLGVRNPIPIPSAGASGSCLAALGRRVRHASGRWSFAHKNDTPLPSPDPLTHPVPHIVAFSSHLHTFSHPRPMRPCRYHSTLSVSHSGFRVAHHFLGPPNVLCHAPNLPSYVLSLTPLHPISHHGHHRDAQHD